MRILLIIIAHLTSIPFVVTQSSNRLSNFFEDIQTQNISGHCATGLKNFLSLNKSDDLSSNKIQAFFAASGWGMAAALISDDRFRYRMRMCVKASGDTYFDVSPTTLIHCHGYANLTRTSKAYSLCLPVDCEFDHVQLLEKWQKTVDPNSTETSIIYSSCAASRYKSPWYRKLLPCFAVLVIILCFFLVCRSTICHLKGNFEQTTFKNRLLLAFSAKKNVPKLFHVPIKCNATIECIFGIRTLMLFWMVVGHVFVLSEEMIENIEDYYNRFSNSFSGQWLTNFVLLTDIFFLLAGTVNAFCWFNKNKADELNHRYFSVGYWLRFYAHRIVRLWPSYFMSMLGLIFMSSFDSHGMFTEVDQVIQCTKHGWQNLLLINSLFQNRCMKWTWYISCEFILFLFSPMFFIALLKSRFVGTVLIIINIVMSAVLRIIVMAIKQLPPAPLYWSTQPVFSGNYEEHYVNIYIKPWHRMGPYLIGIFLGYYLATTDVLVERTRPLTLMLAGWALTILLSFFAIFGLWPVLQGWNWPLYYFFYGAVHRTAFALSGAWLIYACHTDNGGYLNRFLKAKFFIPLSSLSYNIYLWHMPWIYALFTLLPFPITYRSHFPLFVLTTIALVLSCLVAFIFSLMAEIPAINLEKILLNPSLRQQRKNLPFSPVPTNEMDTVNAFQSAYKVDKEECWK